MTPNRQTERIGYAGRRLGWRVQGLVGKLFAFAAAAVLLIGAIALSVVVFAVVMTAILVVGGYAWWKTRELRKQMRAASSNGSVIEGEVVQDGRSLDRDQR